MRGKQCKVEFKYQSSLRFKIEENRRKLDRFGRWEDFPDAYWCLGNSPPLNTRDPTVVPNSAVALFRTETRHINNI
jgi:hypothetical protein